MAGAADATAGTGGRLGWRTRPHTLHATLAAVTAVLFVLSLAVGPVWIPPLEVLAHLTAGGDDALDLIVRDIRLPRALLALIVGGSLGLAGAALQGLLRNPLAEPGLIGVSACAALGAVLTFYTGLAALAFWVLPASGMLGALAAVIALHALAGRGASLLAIILAGVAINSLAGALTTLVLNLSPNPFAAYEIFFWLLGSLTNRSFEHVLLVLPFTAAGWLLLLRTAPALDALTLGEDTAASLGVNLPRLRSAVIAGSALAVGASVAVTGVIGFVGLVVPHLLRPLVGYRPGALLGASALGGAALTLLADLGTRIPTPSGELKLGVVTALVGAPFFLHLVVRSRVAAQ
jgi:iron complex transport system permease protein